MPAIMPHREVEVGSCGHAAPPYKGNLLAGPNRIPHFNQVLSGVGVNRSKSIPVLQDHNTSYLGLHAAEDHPALSRSDDRSPARAGDVNSPVKVEPFQDGMRPRAIPGGDSSGDRPEKSGEDF